MANPNVHTNSPGEQVASQFGIPANGQFLPDYVDPSTGHASAASAGDSMAGSFIDPNGLVGGLYNDLFGFTSQSREQQFQEYMTDKQNKWNSAPELMKRAKEAGINPLTAAGGIAGNGSSSAAPAGGAATPSGAPVDAITNAAGLPSEISERKAGSEAALAQARNADKLASASILKDAASAASALVGCGIPEIAAMELGLKLAQNGLDGFSAAFNADNYCRMYDMDYSKIEAEINNENIRWAEIEARKNLYVSETDWTYAKKEHEDILTGLDSRKLELAKKYEAFMAENGTLQEFLLFKQFGSGSAEYQGYMDYLKDRFYNQSIGGFNADMDTAYGRALNALKGSKEISSSYLAYETGLEALKSEYDELFKSIYENPSNVRGILIKWLNNFSNIPLLKVLGEFDSSMPSSGEPVRSVQRKN